MPDFLTRDGCRLCYDVAGDGPPIVVTPGGREGRKALAPLVEALADSFRVLTWDRRNTGEAGLWFESGRSEQAIWAQDLADLIDALGWSPAWIAGGSAGCRVSLNAVLCKPEIARGLILWSASGGAYASQFLGFSYHVPYIMAAQGGGMEAVAKTPFFEERIAANLANRDYLLSWDPGEFVAIMKFWNENFYQRQGEALAGIEGDTRTIRAPALIFEGNDDIHPAEASRALAREIPGAALVPSPWSSQDFMDRLTGRNPSPVFDLYPQLVPQIRDFIL